MIAPGDVVRLRRDVVQVGGRLAGRMAVLVLDPPTEPHGVCLGVRVTRRDGSDPWRLTRRAIWAGVYFTEGAVEKVVERGAWLEPALALRASLHLLGGSVKAG